VVFGEPETKGMSKIERADEEIRKWEALQVSHEEHHPDAVPMIKWTLEELRGKRAMIDETKAENASTV
jgi:hypothetical protein